MGSPARPQQRNKAKHVPALRTLWKAAWRDRRGRGRSEKGEARQQFVEAPFSPRSFHAGSMRFVVRSTGFRNGSRAAAVDPEGSAANPEQRRRIHGVPPWNRRVHGGSVGAEVEACGSVMEPCGSVAE